VDRLMEAARLVSAAGFGVLASLSFRLGKRPGVRPARPATLLFATLAAASAVTFIVEGGGGRVVAMALLTLIPYPLLRIARLFAAPGRAVDRAVVVSSGAVCLALLAGGASGLGGPWPRLLSAVAVAHLAVWTGVSAHALWSSGGRQPGVTRRRMRTMSLGAAGMGLALVGDELALRGGSLLGATLAQGAALAFAWWFYAGLAPPRFLRRRWRRREQDDLGGAMSELILATRPEEVAAGMLPHVARIVGGRGAALIDEDGVVVGLHGLEAEDLPDLASFVGDWPSGTQVTDNRIELKLRSGWLIVVGSNSTPYFGADEVYLLRSLGALAELALERCKLNEMQRRVHESLEREREFSQSLIDSSGDGIFAFDRDLRYRLWNPEMESISGVRRSDVIGRRAFEVFPFLSGIGEIDSYREALTGKNVSARHGAYRFPAGRWGYFETHYSPQFGKNGEVVGGLGVVRDVTQQKESQEALRLQAERLREQAELLELAHDAIIVRNLDDAIVYWNKGAELTYRWTRDEAIGRDLHRLLDTKFPESRESFTAQLRKEGRWEGELEHATRGKGTVIVASKQVVMNDAHGQPKSVLEINRDITARKEAELAALENEARALHDALTGLPNRPLFLDRLKAALSRTNRTERPVGVLFLDVDHFKELNDSMGHAAGDRVLIAVAERLKSAIRPSDVVARFGGDEFTIMCEDISGPEDVVTIAERIARALNAPLRIGDEQIETLTCSIGSAISTRAGQNPQELLTNADVALYRAKEQGRARHEIYDDDLRRRMAERKALELALDRALDAAEFVVHYQPQFDLESGRIMGAEALVRWRHPQRGLVVPEEFISFAEERGTIVPIGSWVLRESLREAAGWASDGGKEPVVSVNLSGPQLSQPDLDLLVGRALEKAGLPPEALCLEVAESVLMADVEAASTALRALKSVGVKLTMDDFGTGFSSLASLERFPVDYLKIDGSFVNDIGKEPRGATVVAAAIQLGHTLGLATIAEAVESKEQLDVLVDLGCDSAQGFLFSPPRESAYIQRLLGASNGNGREGGDGQRMTAMTAPASTD
jgi:diguanylate cyclase (GGDEF)-like protein/PAS domain S-box-containing protein